MFVSEDTHICLSPLFMHRDLGHELIKRNNSALKKRFYISGFFLENSRIMASEENMKP